MDILLYIQLQSLTREFALENCNDSLAKRKEYTKERVVNVKSSYNKIIRTALK